VAGRDPCGSLDAPPKRGRPKGSRTTRTPEQARIAELERENAKLRAELDKTEQADPQRELLDVESVAGHLLEPGSVFALLAEHRDRLFPSELFADLFPSGRGRPSIPGEVIASGDRAAGAVRPLGPRSG